MPESTLTETETRRTYQYGAMSVVHKETVDPNTYATLRHIQVTRGTDDWIDLIDADARALLWCLKDALGEGKPDAKPAAEPGEATVHSCLTCDIGDVRHPCPHLDVDDDGNCRRWRPESESTP